MANTTMHGAVGAKILALVPNPVGLVLAFLSHFLLDFFPESYLPPKKWYIAGELSLLIIAIVLIFTMGVSPWWMFWGAVVANIPDLIDTVLFKLKGKRLFFCHPKPRIWDLGFDFQSWGMPQKYNLLIDAIVIVILLIG